MKRPICMLLTLLILTVCAPYPAYAEGEAGPSDEVIPAPEIIGTPQPMEVVTVEDTPEPTETADEVTPAPEITGTPQPMEGVTVEDTPRPTETDTVIDVIPEATAELTASPESDTTPEPASTEVAAPTQPADTTSTPETEPTQPAEATTPVTPVNQVIQFQIDDANIYDGMDRAYKDGYVPQVADGVVTLVLPLIANGIVQGNRITVTPNLGDTSASPIQYKNYQKTFSLAENPVNVTGQEGEVIQTVSSYLVRFDFPLRAERKNGTYPIVLDIQATDENGIQIYQSYNCFINITDAQPEETDTPAPISGGGGGGYAGPTEVPVSNPRILVSKYIVSKTPVMAGEDFTVTVTLKNTSDEGDVQNMLVTVSSESTNLVLKNDTSTIFLGDLEAGGTIELELTYGTDRETPAQRYNIALAMEFDDEDAMSMSSAGSITVAVAQPVDVELAPFTMPSEINAGETVQLSFQVMNLGRTGIYNARVEMDVPGLSPSGNAFVGNMEAGTSATQTLNVFAGMKDGDERYGYTSGVVRLIYEDVDGEEYTEEVNTTTNIKELVIATKAPSEEQKEAEKEQAQKTQWWVFVAAGGAFIAAPAVILILRKRSTASPRHVKK